MALAIGQTSSRGRRLALDWDARTVRAVMVRARGESIEVLRAATIPVPPDLSAQDAAAFGRFLDDVTKRFDFFQFVLLNARLELEPGGDAARGRLFICEYRWEKAAGRWTQVFGVYRDRYRRIDGRWWFDTRIMFVDLVGDLSHHLLYALAAH